MKKTIIKFNPFFSGIAATALMVLLSFGLFAQTPPHPNNGGAPGSGNTPVGGGAPIDGGLTVLMLLGAAYGVRSLRRTEGDIPLFEGVGGGKPEAYN